MTKYRQTKIRFNVEFTITQKPGFVLHGVIKTIVMAIYTAGNKQNKRPHVLNSNFKYYRHKVIQGEIRI